MPKVLFWNIGRRNLLKSITGIVASRGIDLLILAESRIPLGEVLKALNSEPSASPFRSTRTLCPSIDIFCRFSSRRIVPESESERMSIRRLSLPTYDEFLLAAVHLPSPLYMSADSQAAELYELSTSIKQVEVRRGHRRTIVVGDFNANPFAPGMVSAAGLNAVMDRTVARGGVRKVRQRIYPYFYNPMWRLMGDDLMGPPGSYFYSRSEDVEYFWHTFDQVLVRPELLDLFQLSTLALLTDDGSESLVNRKGRPRKASSSDHLPLVFELG